MSPFRSLRPSLLCLCLLPACSSSASRPAPSVAAPPAGTPRYGEVMADIAHRYELAGRAARARRWELAAYELSELKEAFEDDLPRAALPREPSNADLKSLARSFEVPLGELQAALLRKDAWAASEAFSHAANACNNCHRSSGHAFLEVPGEPGESVPRMTPLAPPDAGVAPGQYHRE